MPKKGENIYKRKDGRWEGRYIKGRKKNGKAIYGYIYAHSYRDVKNRLHEEMQKAQMKADAACKAAGSKLFAVLAAEWFQYKKSYIKESTYVKYSNVLKNHIVPILGGIKLSDIDYELMNNYCTALMTCGGASKKGLSSKTVSDILSIIRNILRYAARNNDFISVDIGMVIVKQKAKNMRILTDPEQEILLAFIYKELNLRSIGILVCLFTGIRIGELCALKWEDVSLSENLLYIHQTMQRIQSLDKEPDNLPKTKIVITTPKSTCSVRVIPLPNILSDILRDISGTKSEFLLTGRADKWIEPRNMQNYFKQVLKKCKINDAPFHALRHTFATRCIELGFDVKSLSEILGHASVNITMNRYVHPTMDLKRKNMQKLSELLTVK